MAILINDQARRDDEFEQQGQQEQEQRRTDRYDDMLVAPSDEELKLMWILYATLLSIFAIFMAIVFLAIVTNKKVRRKPFNLYLIFLMVPDLIFTTFCAINCAWLAINGGYRFPGMCSFQSFYLIFGIGANAWLNGIIAYEVHKMLRVSYRGHRYSPPERRMVLRNSLLAYGWAAFVALWGVIPIPWLPHKTNVQNGQYCIPTEFNQASTIFFWTIYIPSLVLVPLVFCFSVTMHVLWKKLLPARGQRRDLAIYFFRITAIFLVMWSPPLVVMWGMGGAGGGPWFVWAAALWGHLQGPVSAGASCLKMDIREAVFNFVLSCGGTYKQARKYTPAVEDRIQQVRTITISGITLPCQNGDGYESSDGVILGTVSGLEHPSSLPSFNSRAKRLPLHISAHVEESFELDQKDSEIGPNEKVPTSPENHAGDVQTGTGILYVCDIEEANSTGKGDILDPAHQPPIDDHDEVDFINSISRAGLQGP